MKICLNMNQKLSKNLSYKESIQSATASIRNIDNKPTFEQLVVMKYLAENFFQVLRNNFKVRIRVNSFFRCYKLNKLIGGSRNSDHMIKKDIAAIDIDDTYCRQFGVYNRDMFKHIMENMNYHKLIWEYKDDSTDFDNPKWIHISFSSDPEKNKCKKTLLTNGNGYIQFKDSNIKL